MIKCRQRPNHYYLLAGEPEQFRPVFEQVVPNAQVDLSKIHQSADSALVAVF